MGIEQYRSLDRFGGEILAEAEAEVTESGEYVTWLEESDDPESAELHIQHIEKDFVPRDLYTVLDTLKERGSGNGWTVSTTNGHAVLSIRQWKTPEGDIVGAGDAMTGLLRFL